MDRPAVGVPFLLLKREGVGNDDSIPLVSLCKFLEGQDHKDLQEDEVGAISGRLENAMLELERDHPPLYKKMKDSPGAFVVVPDGNEGLSIVEGEPDSSGQQDLLQKIMKLDVALKVLKSEDPDLLKQVQTNPLDFDYRETENSFTITRKSLPSNSGPQPLATSASGTHVFMDKGDGCLRWYPKKSGRKYND